MKESQIETKLGRLVRKGGGLYYKFVSPNDPGVPDRIIVLPGGRVIFVELKTEVGRLAEIQKWQLKRLREAGAEVRVLKGMEQAEAFAREVMPE